MWDNPSSIPAAHPALPWQGAASVQPQAQPDPSQRAQDTNPGTEQGFCLRAPSGIPAACPVQALRNPPALRAVLELHLQLGG